MKYPQSVNSRSKQQPKGKSWAENCCSCLQLFWPRVVMRKWLNISARESDYSADTDSDDGDKDSASNTEEFCEWGRESRFRGNGGEDAQFDPSNDALSRLRRRKSETFRTQYINTKELRICIGTWNVGGNLPPDDLDIDDWIDTYDPADIYVFGIQEIVPLNAGNIFGAEDDCPVPKWESIIRDALNRIQPTKTKVKCYSDPPSPSKFMPSDDVPDIEEEILLESVGDVGEEIQPLDEAKDSPDTGDIENSAGDVDVPAGQNNGKLTKMLHGTERISLSWPELPLDLLSQHVLQRPSSFEVVKSFKAKLDLDALMKRKRKSSYVRIVSKQMVGIFLTIWVRRSLRKYIQNLRVSTVGVGVMGYIGNKGSISVSMSIYETLFCFICTHLTSGEKDGDELKRNADVHEIHRRTLFHTNSGIGLPKSILDHERIILLGDLNYRINLSYEKTCELISRKEWAELVERDQLVWELRKGHAFDGWTEGTLNFPPTYKYEMNSDKYYGEDPQVGRRVPAWCDRILSYGKGMRLLNYRRTELKLSDHRPVTATYMVEVEVFCPRKLQRALRYTDAEIENEEVLEETIDV
ncbi:type IV inositol polyphosphate 5-phosphatase 3 isoform X2 [Hevea brasiliensis]|uniref:type IV inositol polyphosphate 5-phosphatase 3 isoform X2 n=1 Tax=Hevea brasiliensis TaxID=3981 RepID=UPI0025E6A811|nr:type IV inositol polyphosphate 5-phosphatase 3 isoform X2 [Hevea brasiliensis]